MRDRTEIRATTSTNKFPWPCRIWKRDLRRCFPFWSFCRTGVLARQEVGVMIHRGKCKYQDTRLRCVSKFIGYYIGWYNSLGKCESQQRAHGSSDLYLGVANRIAEIERSKESQPILSLCTPIRRYFSYFLMRELRWWADNGTIDSEKNSYQGRVHVPIRFCQVCVSEHVCVSGLNSVNR